MDVFDSYFRRADLDQDGRISGHEAVTFFQGSNLPKNVLAQVQQLEKEILDSKEKIEFYRTKMQELVLYKTWCDNRLNEITERASADKYEAESLAKKYEERYKQVGEIASKLTVEVATYRHIQERKLELHNAIVKMEQGGSADGLLQVRADRIQSDFEELMKAMNERCKQYGLHVKSTAMVGNLAYKRGQLIGMKIGINLKTKDSPLQRSLPLIWIMLVPLKNPSLSQPGVIRPLRKSFLLFHLLLSLARMRSLLVLLRG